jgi:cytoskeleton protein RodZ
VSIGNSPPGDRTTDDERPSIGQALAQARRSAGMTVDELSTRTRVRVPIVLAIEQDDFSRCGGDFYARGHIRLLARALDLDADALVAQYDAGHGSPAPLLPAKMFEADRIRPERRRPNWTAAMVAAIAVVIAFVGFNLVHGGGHGSGGSAAAAKPSPSASAKPPTSQSHKPGQQKKPDPSNSAIAAVPADKVTVKLTAVGGKSWISAVNGNGRTLFQGVLAQGQSKPLTDPKEIRLVVGNAGAVKLFVNGKDVGPAGNQGEVAHLTFTPGDPQAG